MEALGHSSRYDPEPQKPDVCDRGVISLRFEAVEPLHHPLYGTLPLTSFHQVLHMCRFSGKKQHFGLE